MEVVVKEEDVPKEMVLVANVQLLNLYAQSSGVDGRLLNRPVKGLIKFKNRSRGLPSFIQVSTLNQNVCPKFNVDSIVQIRSNYLEQGMVTIEADNTAIMVKNGKPNELQQLVDTIKLAQKLVAPAVVDTSSKEVEASGQMTKLKSSQGAPTPQIKERSKKESQNKLPTKPTTRNPDAAAAVANEGDAKIQKLLHLLKNRCNGSETGVGNISRNKPPTSRTGIPNAATTVANEGEIMIQKLLHLLEKISNGGETGVGNKSQNKPHTPTTRNADAAAIIDNEGGKSKQELLHLLEKISNGETQFGDKIAKSRLITTSRHTSTCCTVTTASSSSSAIPPPPPAGPLVQSKLNFQTISAEEKMNQKVLMEIRRAMGCSKESGRKRARSPSPQLSKSDRVALKKALSTKGKDVVVKLNSKLDYLKGFASNSTHLSICGISMRRIDSRLLALSHLRHLDLSNNNLVSVDSLRQLNSNLDSLKLGNNQISSLDPRLRFSWSTLTLLDLKNNSLKMLPDSFVYLTQLRSLDVSHNQLRVLPYNMHLMRGLRTLIGNDNNLQFVPQPLASGLCNLVSVDLSHNPQLLPAIDFNYCQLLSPQIGWGSIGDNVPTLMELCAASVLGLGQYRFENWTEGAVPRSIMEYLYRAKRCGRCRLLVSRYIFQHSTDYGRFMAEQVVCDRPGVLVRTAWCPHHAPPSH